MKAGTGKAKPGRIRVRLLAMLWVWALLVFVVVDLFLNVEEFDGWRPRARIYRATRYVAHRMVGEPYREADEFAALGEEPATVRVAQQMVTLPKTSPFLRVFDGVPPDHYTSWRIQLQLQRLARRTDDPARRDAARRCIERMKRMREVYGPQHGWRQAR